MNANTNQALAPRREGAVSERDAVQARPSVLPPVDVYEDENAITVLADLPGVAKDDLTLRVEGDTLTLEADLKLGEAPDMQVTWAEVRAPVYRRSFTLSRELDTARIEAALKDGVLTLTLPKREHARPRRIEVRSA